MAWRVSIPLPRKRKRPGSPLGQRYGGPRRSRRRRGPSLSPLTPDDGARTSGPPTPASGPSSPLQPPTDCQRPRVIETLARARRWRAMIDRGEAKNAAQIASDLGITRARVSQIMALLRLAPEIQDLIDGLNGDEGAYALTERGLRQIALIEDRDEQRQRFAELVGALPRR